LLNPAFPAKTSSANKLIKTLVFLIAVSVSFMACSKNSMTPSRVWGSPGNEISGEWEIDSLVSVFRYANGDIRGTQVYPMESDDDFYFHFNNDGTWSETATFSTTDPVDLTESSGNYVLRSDTTFDMIFQGNQILNCKITRLTPESLVFHRSYPTLFDGTIPGTIERIFTLKK